MNIPGRKVRDAYERINGDGSRLAGAIRRLKQTADRKPKDALKKWR